MKKLLSIILSLLMLALPVFSVAEDSPAADAASDDFVINYDPEEEMKMTTIHLIAGDQLPKLLSAAFSGNLNKSQGILDLLSSLDIQVKKQAAEGGWTQFALDLLLDGESTVNLILASTPEGIFASSSLLGDDIYAVTSEQLMNQLSTLFQQAGGSDNPLSSLFASPDSLTVAPQINFEDLQEALLPIIYGMTIEDVTSVPDLLPNAASLTRIPLKKDDLSALMKAIAKAAWPSVQSMASMIPSGGQPLTEESLAQELSALPGALRQDSEILIYTTADGSDTYTTTSLEIAPSGGNPVSVHLDLLSGNEESETSSSWILSIAPVQEESAETESAKAVSDETPSAETESAETESAKAVSDETPSAETESAESESSETSSAAISVIVSGSSSSGPQDYSFTTNLNIQNGSDESFCPMELDVKGSNIPTEQGVSKNASIVIRTRNSASQAPMGYTIQYVEEPFGSDVPLVNSGSLTFGIENVGSLLSVSFINSSSMAEAYIASPDAIYPLSLSQEELKSLGQTIIENLQTNLITILQKLPATTLQLFVPAQ